MDEWQADIVGQISLRFLCPTIPEECLWFELEKNYSYQRAYTIET